MMAGALAREKEHQEKIAGLEKTLADLKAAHEKALADKDAEVNSKAFKLALKEYGKAAKDGKIETAQNKEDLQKQYDAVKHDVFARAKFLKSLSKADRETLVPSRK